MRKALISGAGIAGATAAYWLAKAGFDVTVVEQARGMRSSGSPVDVRGTAVEVAERMGVMAQIREASTQVRDMVFVNARGRVTSRVDMRAWGDPGDVELPRGDLAAILRAAVPDEVEFEFGNTVTALDQDADGVTAEFTSGPARRFDVVIGADGAHSGVRALAFGPEAEFVKHLGVYVAILPLDGETGTGLRHVQRTRTIGGRPPCAWPADRGVHVPRTPDTAFRPPRPGSAQAAAELGLRRCRLARAGAADRVIVADDLYFDSVSRVRVPTWSNGRVVLVGDAASCVALFGDSSSLAMTGAFTLAANLFVPATWAGIAVRNVAIRFMSLVNKVGETAFRQKKVE